MDMIDCDGVCIKVLWIILGVSREWAHEGGKTLNTKENKYFKPLKKKIRKEVWQY